MKIRELYEKLDALDTARADNISTLRSVKEEVGADMGGLLSSLDGYADRMVTSVAPDQIRMLDAAFTKSGISFSPADYVAGVEAQSTGTLRTRTELASKHGGTLEALSARVKRERGEHDAFERKIEQKVSELRAVMAKLTPVTDYNRACEFAGLRGALITLDKDIGYLEAPVDRWRWLTDGAYRSGRKALAAVGDFKTLATSRRELEGDIDLMRSELAENRAKTSALEGDLTAYRKQANKVVPQEDVVATIREKIKEGFDNQTFLDAFAGMLPEGERETFLETAVKLRGLQQIDRFVDGKIAAITKERSDMSSTLSKLRKAKSHAGSRTVKGDVSGEALDKAVAGTKLQGAYYARNARHAHRDTMRFDTSSAYNTQHQSDNTFLWMMLFYHQMLLSSSTADAAVTKDIVGVNEANASQYGLNADQFAAIQPDYAATLGDLAQVGGADALSGLGLDASTLASLAATDGLQNLSLPDMSSVSASISQAANDASSAAASVSTSDFSSSFSSSSYDSGGSFSSGGFDGGGSSAFYKAPSDDDLLMAGINPRKWRGKHAHHRPHAGMRHLVA